MRKIFYLFFLVCVLLFFSLANGQIILLQDLGTALEHGPYDQIIPLKNSVIAANHRGVDIYNTSNFANATLVSSIATTGRVLQIQYSIPWLLILDSINTEQSRLFVYNMTNQTAPVLLETIESVGPVRKFKWENQKFYLGYDDSLSIYNYYPYGGTPTREHSLSYPSSWGTENTRAITDIYTNNHFVFVHTNGGMGIWDAWDMNSTNAVTMTNLGLGKIASKAFCFESFKSLQSNTFWGYDISGMIPNSSSLPISNKPNSLSFFMKDIHHTSRQLYAAIHNEVLAYEMVHPLLVTTPNIINTSDTLLAIARQNIYTIISSYNNGQSRLLVNEGQSPDREHPAPCDTLIMSENIIDLDGNNQHFVGISANKLYLFTMTGNQAVLLDQANLPTGSGKQVALRGARILVAAGASGLYSFSITNNLLQANGQIRSGTINTVTMNEHLAAYFIQSTNQFVVMDHLSPQQPILGTYAMNATVSHIALNEQFAYVAKGTSGLTILDYTDLQSISVAGSIACRSGENFNKVYVENELLSIAAGNCVRVFLTHNPLDNEQIAASGATTGVIDLVPDYNLFHYITNTRFCQTLQVLTNGVDYLNKDYQTYRYQLPLVNDTVISFAFHGDRFVVSHTSGSFDAWDLDYSNPLDGRAIIHPPTPVHDESYIEQYGDFSEMAPLNNYLLLTANNCVLGNQLLLFDMTNPNQPINTETIQLAGELTDINTYNEAYVYGKQDESILVFQLSGNQLNQVGTIGPLAGLVSARVFQNSLIAGCEDSLVCYRIDQNPAVPQRTDSRIVQGKVEQLATTNQGVFYLNNNHNILKVTCQSYLFTNEEQVVGGNGVEYINAHEDMLYFFTQNAHIYRFNAATQEAAQFLSDQTDRQNLSFAGQLMIVHRGDKGYRIFNISQATPQLIEDHNGYNESSTSAFFNQRNLLVMNEKNSLHFYGVNNDNHAPVFNNMPATMVTLMARTDYALDINVTDEDGDNLSLTFLNPIENASLNDRRFTFTADDNQVDTFSFYFKADDGKWGITYDTLTIAIIPFSGPPTAFSLLSPIEGTLLQTSAITFTWQMAQNADHYKLFYGNDTTLWQIAQTGQPTLQLNLPQAMENHRIYWRVRAYLSDTTYFTDNSGGVSSLLFDQVDEVPGFVTLVSPVNGERVATKSPEFKFLKPLGNDPRDSLLTYRMEVSVRRDFPGVPYRDSLIRPPSGLDTLTLDSINTELQEGQFFYWRVSACDDQGNNSGFSQADSFLVDAQNDAPYAFNLIEPSEKIVFQGGSVITLRWNSTTDPNIGDEVQYVVSVSNHPQLTSLLLVDTLDDTTRTFTLSDDNTIYYWQVMAFDGKGGIRYSNQAPAEFARNDANEAPHKPSPYYPGMNMPVDTIHPQLVVTNTTDPDPYSSELSYHFYVATNIMMSTIIDSSGPVSQDSSGRTSWRISQNYAMAYDTLYWFCRSHDGELSSGDTPMAFYFELSNHIPAQFELIEPADQLQTTATTLTFRWNRSLDADLGDWVRYRFSIDTLNTMATAFTSSAMADTVYSHTYQFVQNRVYYWQVTAYDPIGAERVSALRRFICYDPQTGPTAPGGPYSPSADQLVSTPTITFRFTNSTDPNESDIIIYTIQLDTINTFQSPALRTFSNISENSSGSMTSYLYTGILTDNKHYFWRVMASDGHTTSNYCDAQSFYLNHTQESPSLPELISPSENEIVAWSLTFSWLGSTDPDPYDSVRYTFQLFTDKNDTTQVYYQASSLANSFITLGDSSVLKNDYLYFWRVKAIDGSGRTQTTSLKKFYVSYDLIPKLKAFNIVSPQNSETINPRNLKILWRAAKDSLTSGYQVSYLITLFPLGSPQLLKFYTTQDTMLNISDTLQERASYQMSIKAFKHNDPQSLTHSNPDTVIFFTQGEAPGNIIDFNYSMQLDRFNLKWKSNPFQPYDFVRIYCDYGTGQLNPQSWQTLNATDTACTIPFSLWPAQQATQVWQFKIQAENNSGEACPAEPVILSLTPSVVTPWLAYPSVNTRIAGDGLTIVHLSPWNTTLSGSYRSYLEVATIPFQIDTSATNHYWFAINSLAYQLITNMQGSAIVFRSSNANGGGVQQPTMHKVRFFSDTIQPQLYQTFQTQSSLQESHIQLSQGEALRWAAQPLNRSIFYYRIHIPMAVDENGFSMNTSFTKYLNSEEIEACSTLFNVYSTDWDKLQDSVTVILYQGPSSNALYRGFTQPSLWFKPEESQDFDSIPTQIDTTFHTYTCRIKRSGSLRLKSENPSAVAEDAFWNNDAGLCRTFPNPFTHFVRLEVKNLNSTNGFKCAIYDIQGRLVWEAETHQSQLDWHGIDRMSRGVASGIYFYIIQDPATHRQIAKGRFLKLK